MLVTSWTEIMTSQPSFQDIFALRRPKVANFAGIIKIATKFIQTTFKDLKKSKDLEILDDA